MLSKSFVRSALDANSPAIGKQNSDITDLIATTDMFNQISEIPTNLEQKN